MRAIYFRERRKKAAKEQDTVSNVKLEEFESSEINISADEFEEEEEIYDGDKSSSFLDITSEDIEKCHPSESEWEEENDDDEEQQNQMENREIADQEVQSNEIASGPKLSG